MAIDIQSLIVREEDVEIAIIKSIQSISNAFFDVFFLTVTRLGEEFFFLFLFSILYWCISKSTAMKMGLFYGVSASINLTMKRIINRPRPYLVDDGIRNVKQAIGTSFPSGHSQSYGVLASFIGLELHRKKYGKTSRVIFTIALLLGAFLVPISRMYLGQHYLTDTLAGLAIGFVIAYFGEMLYSFFKKKISIKHVKMAMLGILIIGGIALIVCGVLGVDNSDVYQYGVMMVSLLGCYLIEDRWIGYQPTSHWNQGWKKLVLGFGVILAICIPLMILLSGIVQICVITSVYIVITMIVMPLLFQWLFREKKV